MSTEYSDIDSQELREFASFEGIEIAGTHDHGAESDFEQWLEGIDLHADVEVIEEHVSQELSGLSGEEFGNLTPKELSALVKEALADIKFDDDGRPDGEIGAAAPNSSTLTPSTEKGVMT